MSYSSGYTCTRCGNFVPYGTLHYCWASYPPPTTYPQPTYSSPYPYMPVLERIAAALEKIAAALEKWK